MLPRGPEPGAGRLPLRGTVPAPRRAAPRRTHSAISPPAGSNRATSGTGAAALAGASSNSMVGNEREATGWEGAHAQSGAGGGGRCLARAVGPSRSNAVTSLPGAVA